MPGDEVVEPTARFSAHADSGRRHEAVTETIVGDDIASLLASGERAAFHGPPGSAVSVLEQAVVTAQRQGLRAEVTAAAWLLGVALAAAGRYGGAVQVLTPLLEPGEAADSLPEQRLFASFAASTMASVQRQLGRHGIARELDLRALASAVTPEAVFDANLGLAADAVGLGERDAAAEALAEAAALVEERRDWWRQQVRLDWVRAEVALLDGEPHAAAALAAGAVERAEAARAPRHVAKGLLFQAVAEVHAGLPDAAATLRRAATLAESLGTLPLIWPSRALLGALLEGTDDVESAKSLAAARSAVLAIAGDLPPAVREEWLARSDVGALLGG